MGRGGESPTQLMSTNKVGGIISSMGKTYRKSSHEIKYHFIWIPKYRFRVLEGAIKKRIEELIGQICEAMEILIVEGKICKDHVHVCLSVPPKYSPAEVMKQIKGKSLEAVFKEFPELKKRYWGQHFWGRGYFVSTIGIDEMTIKDYIKNQQEDDTVETQMKLWN